MTGQDGSERCAGVGDARIEGPTPHAELSAVAQPRLPDGRVIRARCHPSSTTYERRSLNAGINLSDAHCRQPLTSSQEAIIARAPELFQEAHRRSHLEIEEDFLDAFARLAGQGQHLPRDRALLSYSASSAITMLASYFRRFGKRVGLIEPVFDNIPSILRREQVELVPVPEPELDGDGWRERLDAMSVDCIWLVCPNNPTGWALRESDFPTLVESCASNGRTLVSDASFRFFSQDLCAWSQYERLEESGVSYVIIEDTGKTWSTHEMKVGLTVCSDDLYPEIYRLHDDLLQAVSPFHLLLLKELIDDALRLGLKEVTIRPVRERRQILRDLLGDVDLVFETDLETPVAVDWLRLPAGVSGVAFGRATSSRGVHVLPGVNFYWAHPHHGHRYIRLPLARAASCFVEAAPVLREVTELLTASAGAQPVPPEGRGVQ